MKIAICLSGFPRSVDKTIKSFLENVYFDKNIEFHIYGHFWGDLNIDIKEKYNFKKIIVENFSDFVGEFEKRSKQFINKRQEVNVINVISMWYKIYKCFNLVLM